MTSDISESILKSQLQRELKEAKELESQGNMKAAGMHYGKAAVLYRKVGAMKNPREAQRTLEVAGQYENIGQAMRNPEKSGTKISDSDLSPEVYEQAVSSLIVTEKPDTTWNDIGGLEEAKKTIKEAIVLPFVKNKPSYVKSPKSVLLYGPPGMGKTLIAKASSHVIGATFFEARASVLLSKYFGESSKLVNGLFSKARKTQPSLIFIDEIDALAMARSGSTNEASRRVLSEFLMEMDGFNTKKDDRILIIAATNKPWDLDDAIVSRFQRKIFIPMPDEEARKSIMKIHLKGAELSGVSVDELANKTDFYSGRDLMGLCEEAVIGMVREQNPKLNDMEGKQLENYTIRTRPLTQADFERALDKIKPSIDLEDIEKFRNWEREFGG